MDISQQIHGYTPQGEIILSYTLTNEQGAYVTLSNIGANIVGIGVPDKEGNIVDVCPGYRDIHQFFTDPPYFGKTVGRFANRIAKGKFTIDGKTYHVALNNGPNHLHGGPGGMANKVWVSRVEDGDEAISFAYHSPAGEENYPGNMQVTVTYRWSEENILYYDMRATTDQTCIINLTNHAYFNLGGEGSGPIHDHLLQIPAAKYLPVDPTCIPLGAPESVEGTPFDFRTPKPIGRDINLPNTQLEIGHGYDHCWCLPQVKDGTLQTAAVLHHPESGRLLTIKTTQPGLQVYTGNWLDGNGEDKNGRPHQNRYAVALECQNYPDAPNQSGYPPCLLHPGERFHEQIVFEFSTK